MQTNAKRIARPSRWLAMALATIAVAGFGQSWAAGAPAAGAEIELTGGTLATAHAGVLDAQGLVPGASRSGSMTVANRGSRAARLKLEVHVDDAPGPLGGHLSEALRIEIVSVDGQAGQRIRWSGRLSDVETLDAAALAPGRERTFRLVIRLPNDAPNAVQGSAARLRFHWSG
jgi:hypothetical protein